jgi:hypothetical protein
MFCPNCGAADQIANAFCKRCGDWLPDIKRRTGPAFGGETPQQNIITSLFMSALSTLAALFSAIALYATYLGKGDAKWSVYLAAAFCLCIAGWQASSFVVGLKLRQRLNKGRESTDSSSELPAQQTRSELDAGGATEFVGRAGVTEGTTRILESAQTDARHRPR